MTQWVRTISAAQLHKHLLRGSQLDRSTLRHEFEQLHQAWPWSGLARFGPTTPMLITPELLRSIRPTRTPERRRARVALHFQLLGFPDGRSRGGEQDCHAPRLAYDGSQFPLPWLLSTRINRSFARRPLLFSGPVQRRLALCRPCYGPTEPARPRARTLTGTRSRRCAAIGSGATGAPVAIFSIPRPTAAVASHPSPPVRSRDLGNGGVGERPIATSLNGTTQGGAGDREERTVGRLHDVGQDDLLSPGPDEDRRESCLCARSCGDPVDRPSMSGLSGRSLRPSS